MEKDLYYYKKTSRDLKKKLREKMVSGMGTSVESDVFMASSELEAQHKSTDVYTKQLTTDVSRMKVNIPLVICKNDCWLPFWPAFWVSYVGCLVFLFGFVIPWLLSNIF